MRKHLFLFLFIFVYIILATFYGDVFLENITSDFYDYLKVDLKGQSNGLTNILSAYVYSDDINYSNDLALIDAKAEELSSLINNINQTDSNNFIEKLKSVKSDDISYLIVDNDGNILYESEYNMMNRKTIDELMIEIGDTKSIHFERTDYYNESTNHFRGNIKRLSKDRVVIAYYVVSPLSNYNIIEATEYLKSNISEISENLGLSLVTTDSSVYYSTIDDFIDSKLDILDYSLSDVTEGRFINVKNKELIGYKYFFIEPLEFRDIYLMTAIKDDALVERLKGIRTLEVIIFFINIFVILIVGLLFDSKWIKKNT